MNDKKSESPVSKMILKFVKSIDWDTLSAGAVAKIYGTILEVTKKEDRKKRS